MSFFPKHSTYIRVAAVLLAIAATGSPAAEVGFVDPLYLPARESDRAASKLMVDVAALTNGRLVAVGEHGTVIWSDDRGDSWRQAKVPVSVNLTAVFFFDAESGWAVGHDGVILGTQDGGQAWAKLFDGNAANEQVLAVAERRLSEVQERSQGAGDALSDSLQSELEQAEDALADAKAGSRFGPARPLFSLWFKDARQGFAAGAFGQLFRTDDGGTTWHYIGDRLDNPEGFHYNAIAHTSSGKLVVVGEGGIIHVSADGGNTWQRHETGYNGQLYGLLAFRDARGNEAMLAYGFGGRIFVSRDGGSDWNEVDNPVRTNIVAGFVATNGSLRLINAAGQVLLGEDDGNRFMPVGVLAQKRIAAATHLSDSSLVLVGTGGVHLVAGTEK